MTANDRPVAVLRNHNCAPYALKIVHSHAPVNFDFDYLLFARSFYSAPIPDSAKIYEGIAAVWNLAAFDDGQENTEFYGWFAFDDEKS